MIWYYSSDNDEEMNDYENFDDVRAIHEEEKTEFCRSGNSLTTKDGTFDLAHVQRCLGWKPLTVIENTLKATTQLAENHVRLPMRMHFKSRSPALNVNRLREVFATDTFFSSEKALDGFTMAQLYVRKTSTFTAIYGMKSEN